MIKQEAEYLHIADAAKILGVSTDTLRRWAHRPALQGGMSLAAHPLIYGLPRMSRDAPEPPAKNGHWRRVWARLGLGGGCLRVHRHFLRPIPACSNIWLSTRQINRKKQGNNDRNQRKMDYFKKFGAKFGGSPKLKPTGC